MTNLSAAVPDPSLPALRPLPVDVVSVQSQVIYGRVGNAVAVPTLQAHGLAVAAVPTVVLSNTPHYPSIHGGPVPVDWFEGFLADLQARGALSALRAVLTGYLGGLDQAAALGRWIRERCARNHDTLVVVDPVIGDHDHGIYVDPRLVQAYRNELLPLADVLTPNDFELSQLAGRALADEADIVDAARSLLVGRTRAVVVTSANPTAWPDGQMHIAVVTRGDAQVLVHPRIDIAPKGTGDLFAATLAAQMLAGAQIGDAAKAASARVVQTIERTRLAGCEELVLL